MERDLIQQYPLQVACLSPNAGGLSFGNKRPSYSSATLVWLGNNSFAQGFLGVPVDLPPYLFKDGLP